MTNLLTISSHVVHGYVGNKAIVFPLQCLGWEVDTINTVNFSNHTGYGIFDGTVLSCSLLRELLEGQTMDFLITGYIPNKELIDTIYEYFKSHNNKPFIYLMDPIMGDENQLYVDSSCIDSYRNLLTLGLIDIITPNQFELELLTGVPIKTLDDLLLGIEKIKSFGIKFVIITSTTINLTSDVSKNFIYCVISTGSSTKYFQIPLIDSYFTGVGDLFSGLLIDKLYKNYYAKNLKSSQDDAMEALSISVNQVLSIMHEVLKSTNEKGMKSGSLATIGDLNIGNYELDLINSKKFYDSEECHYKCFDL